MRAADSLNWSYDQDRTARMSVAASPASSASSLLLASRSSAASSASGCLPRPAARPTAMPSASGSLAHSSMISSAASGSAATRSRPSLRASISRASAWLSTSSVISAAPSAATSPASSLRLVTTTRQPGEPGSSGRTWAALVALSSTTRIRLPSTRLRYMAARSSAAMLKRRGGTPRPTRRSPSASTGVIGGRSGSPPRRSTYSWPSGKRLATWRPKWTASALLPTPAVPEMTMTPTESPARERLVGGRIACIARSSSWRPAKACGSSGSWAGKGTPCAPGHAPGCPEPPMACPPGLPCPSGRGAGTAPVPDPRAVPAAPFAAPAPSPPSGASARFSAGSMLVICW